MQDKPAIGRITNLSPIFWKDGWPVWGTPDAPGRVPARAIKPVQGQPLQQPATSDDFDTPALGLQWAWNHNPDDARWSLRERPGFLRLKATRAAGFWTARNTLTQKGQGPYSRADVRLDAANLAPGDRCGVGTLGKVNAGIAVVRDAEGALHLERHTLIDNGDKQAATALPGPRVALRESDVTLRTEMDFERARGRLSWLDGATWRPLGDEFELIYDWRTGTFQGPQYALFCFNTGSGPVGHVDVDGFRFSDRRDKP
jgi:beta-xylosidase